MSLTVLYVMIALAVVVTIVRIIYTNRKPELKEKKAKQGKNSEVTTAKRINTVSTTEVEFLQGQITLRINPGAKSRSVSDLISLLSENPDIKIGTIGGISGEGSWIDLNVQKPLPLFQVLSSIPAIREVTKNGKDIHIVAS